MDAKKNKSQKEAPVQMNQDLMNAHLAIAYRQNNGKMPEPVSEELLEFIREKNNKSE